MALGLKLFLVTWVALVAAVHRRKGINDCLKNKTLTFNDTVTYSVPYRERNTRFCWSIPPWCSYTVDKVRVLTRVQEQNVSRERPSCCEGYQEYHDGDHFPYPECQHSCHGKCHPFGVCVGPRQCACDSGQRRTYCDASDAQYREQIPSAPGISSPPRSSVTPPSRHRRDTAPNGPLSSLNTSRWGWGTANDAGGSGSFLVINGDPGGPQEETPESGVGNGSIPVPGRSSAGIPIEPIGSFQNCLGTREIVLIAATASFLVILISRFCSSSLKTTLRHWKKKNVFKTTKDTDGTRAGQDQIKPDKTDIM